METFDEGVDGPFSNKMSMCITLSRLQRFHLLLRSGFGVWGLGFEAGAQWNESYTAHENATRRSAKRLLSATWMHKRGVRGPRSRQCACASCGKSRTWRSRSTVVMNSSSSTAMTMFIRTSPASSRPGVRGRCAMEKV